MDSRRQQKVASVIQKDLAAIFQKEGSKWYGSAFVSISGVRVSPDMSIASIYISIFKQEDPQTIVDRLNAKSWDIRYKLGQRVRHSLRKTPEIRFFLDDSLDEVFRMEQIFKDL
jgi:ribosome-binding factor A